MQKLNLVLVILAVVSAILITCNNAFTATPEGNPAPQRMIFKKGDVFLLSELGAVIKNDSGNVTIELVLPENKRTEEYQAVDLENGDVILMMNGKKIRSIEDLEDNYDLIAVGDDIKLGIKREGSMMIVSFPKAEEHSTGGQRMMIIKSGDEEGEQPAPEASNMKILTLKDGEKSILLHDLGILLQEKEDGLYVVEVLPDAGKEIKDAGIKGGEKLVSIQGHEVGTLDEFTKIYDEIPAGETAKAVFEKDGNPVTVKFTKSSENTRSIIIKQ
jgi:predicted metalloprotease with PDZ domain